jgi:hypothetical protein
VESRLRWDDGSMHQSLAWESQPVPPIHYSVLIVGSGMMAAAAFGRIAGTHAAMTALQ